MPRSVQAMPTSSKNCAVNEKKEFDKEARITCLSLLFAAYHEPFRELS